MKKELFLGVILLSIGACNNAKTNKVTESDTKNEVTILLNNWHKAAAEANYNAYFSKMDSDAVFLGTDATENWTKKEFEAYSKPYFDNGKAWDFKTLKRNIYTNSNGNYAWFDEHLKTKRGTFRGSGILAKIEGNWKIKHYVLSVPIPNDDMNNVVNITRKNDSIFLSNFK